MSGLSESEAHTEASSPTGSFRIEPCLLPIPLPGSPQCAFTVDVEDWYQSSFDYDAPITDRVERNCHRLLGILTESKTHATMFVQGRVAEAFPKLIQEFVKAGHEVQSHGYSHRPLFSMDRAALRRELEFAKKTVEDASGQRVTSFRAQDFSILAQNLWALETILDLGFTTDSSIFPLRMNRYGIKNWEPGPHHIHLEGGRRILEVPVVTSHWGRLPLPIAGGGYFRLLPGIVLERALRGVMARNRPVVIYCHPYEFSPDEMSEYRASVPLWRRMHQGLGRGSFVARVQHLLKRLPFGRLDQVLSTWKLA